MQLAVQNLQDAILFEAALLSPSRGDVKYRSCSESEPLNLLPCHLVDDMTLVSCVFINRGCDI